MKVEKTQAERQPIARLQHEPRPTRWVIFWGKRDGLWRGFEGRYVDEGIEYRSGAGVSWFNSSSHFSEIEDNLPDEYALAYEAAKPAAEASGSGEWKPGQTVRLDVSVGYASPSASMALAPPAPATVEMREALGSPDGWQAKLDELYRWSGSAFLAGEKVEDEADHKFQLYGFLCSLIGYLTAGKNLAAAALAAPATDLPEETDRARGGGDPADCNGPDWADEPATDASEVR